MKNMTQNYCSDTVELKIVVHLIALYITSQWLHSLLLPAVLWSRYVY